MTTINFTQYSTDQLVQSLEDIDDINCPINALTLYKVLLERLNLCPDSIDVKKLGYDSSLLQKMLITGLTAFSLSAVLLENIDHKKHEMSEKIIRLNNIMRKNSD